MTRSAVLLLGRRVLRSTTTWAPCVVVGVVVLVFTTLFVVMSGFALSGPQVADREVGRAERAVMVGVVPGEALGTPETADEVRAGMLAAGATDAWPTLLSFDVRPDVLPRAMTTGPSRLIRYVEGERLDDLFPAVRRLEDGRWPQSPGEVAVSSGLRERLVAAGGLDGDEIEVFSGLVTLRVTGTFVDEYDQAGSSLVGAPGTWGAMPGDEIAQRFAGVAAMFRLYWTGDPPDGDVAAVLQQHLAPESSPAAELVAEGLRRTDLERSPDFSLTDTTGFIFTFPMLASLVAAAALAGRLAMVRSLALVTTTTRVGLRRRRVATMLLGVAVTCGLVATAVGAVLGAALGATLRWAVVPWLTNQPVGPFRDVLPIAAAAVLAVLVVLPLASVRLFTAADVTSRVAGLAGLVPWTFLRRLLAVVLVVRVAGSVRSDGAQAAAADLLVAQALVAALLLVPDLLRGAVAAIPTRRATGLLVRRFMQAERARFAVMGILVALSLAAPTAVSTYVATTTRTEAAGNMAQVPRGQLWIDRSQGQPAASASAVVAEETGLQPVALEFTAAYTEGDLDSATPTAGSILALRSREDLETLMGRDVSAASLETLADGGVVLITGERHGRSVLVQEGAAPPTALDVPVSYQPGAPPELQQVAAGLVLAASAQELGIPRTPRLDVYVGLDDTEIRAAVAAVADGGRDTHAIQFHVVPEPTRATRDWYTAAVGLLSSCVLVLGAMMAGHGRQLREHGDRLVAIGIGRRTTFRVALVELALLILTAGLVAVVATVAALAVLAAAVQRQLLLDVPWTFVGFTVASTVAGCVLVLAGALRRGPAQVPRSSRRRILPVTVFGSSSSTTT